MPYTFSAEEIQAEIQEIDKELFARYKNPFISTDRERFLVECVAELRLRVARLEQWIGNL